MATLEKLRREICGHCCRWMKELCPREDEQYQGLFPSPNCDAPGCDRFARAARVQRMIDELEAPE